MKSLFEQWAGEPCLEQLSLGANGSNRKYYRLKGATHVCIAAVNEDVRENDTFLYYSNYFAQQGLPVPEIYAVSDDRRCYLQQDLGDTTLYSYLYDKKRSGGGFDSEMLSLYKQALSDLVRFQTAAGMLDYSRAYPRSDFDRQSMQWDLNYFKYYFLKTLYVPFDEQLLENDFQTLMDYLLQERCDFFMYRDFQSRNTMMLPQEGNCAPKLYYIDYQGGRRGAAQYDVASLLYSAKSDLPEPIRQELLSYYIAQLEKQVPSLQETSFRNRFYGYVLLRIMQAMGAYGYRGFFEHKDYFVKSIPLAINNLRVITESHPLPIPIPHLQQVWKHIGNLSTATSPASSTTSSPLVVTVSSFSYKKGLPQDPSGNGGGFVFDCRALPNPGRYPEYRCYTGKDQPVITFLQKEPAVDQFLQHVQQLVAQSVEQYTERNFTSLMVSFGCTGGQHRSVYCAEQLAEFLRRNYSCTVVVKHIEQD